MKVTFYSPGTFVAEMSDVETYETDPNKIALLANDIKERYGATPYAFRFKGVCYYLGGKVLTLDDIPDTPENHILRANMIINGWDRVIENTNSYRWVMPLDPDDVVLDFKPAKNRVPVNVIE